MDIKKKMNVRLGDDLSLRLIFDGFQEERDLRRGSGRAGAGHNKEHSRKGSSNGTHRKGTRSSRPGSSEGRGAEMAVAKYDRVAIDDGVSTQI